MMTTTISAPACDSRSPSGMCLRGVARPVANNPWLSVSNRGAVSFDMGVPLVLLDTGVPLVLLFADVELA